MGIQHRGLSAPRLNSHEIPIYLSRTVGIYPTALNRYPIHKSTRFWVEKAAWPWSILANSFAATWPGGTARVWRILRDRFDSGLGPVTFDMCTPGAAHLKVSSLRSYLQKIEKKA